MSKNEEGRSSNWVKRDRVSICVAIKNVGTDREKVKARLVVQGHTDREKYNVVRDTTTLHQVYIRIVAALAAMHHYKIWAHDITQAYLQSDSPLRRDVFLRPPREMKIPKSQVLRLIKPSTDCRTVETIGDERAQDTTLRTWVRQRRTEIRVCSTDGEGEI